MSDPAGKLATLLTERFPPPDQFLFDLLQFGTFAGNRVPPPLVVIVQIQAGRFDSPHDELRILGFGQFRPGLLDRQADLEGLAIGPLQFVPQPIESLPARLKILRMQREDLLPTLQFGSRRVPFLDPAGAFFGEGGPIGFELPLDRPAVFVEPGPIPFKRFLASGEKIPEATHVSDPQPDRLFDLLGPDPVLLPAEGEFPLVAHDLLAEPGQVTFVELRPLFEIGPLPLELLVLLFDFSLPGLTFFLEFGLQGEQFAIHLAGAFFDFAQPLPPLLFNAGFEVDSLLFELPLVLLHFCQVGLPLLLDLGFEFRTLCVEFLLVLLRLDLLPLPLFLELGFERRTSCLESLFVLLSLFQLLLPLLLDLGFQPGPVFLEFALGLPNLGKTLLAVPLDFGFESGPFLVEITLGLADLGKLPLAFLFDLGLESRPLVLADIFPGLALATEQIEVLLQCRPIPLQPQPRLGQLLAFFLELDSNGRLEVRSLCSECLAFLLEILRAGFELGPGGDDCCLAFAQLLFAGGRAFLEFLRPQLETALLAVQLGTLAVQRLFPTVQVGQLPTEVFENPAGLEQSPLVQTSRTMSRSLVSFGIGQ